MKKTLILNLIISSLCVSVSFAAEETFFENVKGFFVNEKKTEIRQEFKSFFSTGTEDLIDSISISTTTETSVTNTKKEVKKEIKEIVCENKTKLFIKKEKINKQIKNQIKDKNKLSAGLLEISTNLGTSTKEKIEDKIIKLEEEVTAAIKIQKNILNIIASSTENACDVTSNQNNTLKSSKKINANSVNLIVSTTTNNLNKIKSLELENDKQLEKINRFIKKEIKDLLVEIKEE